MPDPVDLSAVFGLPPEEAIAYFEAKGYTITWGWKYLWQEAQARSFTVAKVMRVDILQDIRGALDDALNNGTTLRDFQKSLTPVLQAKGWWGRELASKVKPGMPDLVDTGTGEIKTVQLGSARRLKTIYQTNLQAAYMAGRYQRQMQNIASHPYWQYVAVMDGRTRPTHRAMNGRVFRYDDAMWGAMYPPNGFNCRCRVSAISKFEAERDGIQMESSGDRFIDHDIHLKDGSTVPGKALRIKVDGQDKLFAPDAGWSYNPGNAVFGNDIEVMRKVSAVKDRAVRVQAVQAINNSELRHQVFANWVSSALVKRAPGHEAQVVGFVSEDIADFAKKHNSGVDPARVLALPEKRLMHADSAKHQTDGIALTLDEYKSLPQIVAKPDAVYWDTQERDVVYTASAQDGRVIYLPARLDYNVKKLGRMDVLVNAYKVEAGRFDSARYVKMSAP